MMTIGREDFSLAMDECVVRWPMLKTAISVYYKHLNWMNYEAFDRLCKRFVEDFRSMPLVKDFKEGHAEWQKENFTKDTTWKERQEFIILNGVNCTCGKRNVFCIQEPIDSIWQCRNCYSGLTTKEIRQRMNDIIVMLESDNRKKVPEWYVKIEPIPF